MGAIPTRVLTGLALLTLTVTITACSGTADPTPPPTPTQSASGARSATPSPTPTEPVVPVMPEAAKAHTQAGAKAFVRYFWQVVNYAQATGDTSGITAISVGGCKGCEGGVAGISKVYAAGGTIRGGKSTPSHLKVEWLQAGKLQLAYVTVVLRFSAQVVDMPGAGKDTVTRSSRARDRLELLADSGGWKVAQLRVLP